MVFPAAAFDDACSMDLYCQLLTLLVAGLIIAAPVIVCGQNWSEPPADPKHCARRGWPVDPEQQSATCSLEIVGRGFDRPGIQRIRLNCTSNSSYIPLVGVASTGKNSPYAGIAADIRQQLQQQAQGVKLSRDLLPCQQALQEPQIEDDLYPMFALLVFCSGRIHLHGLVITDLWLPYRALSRVQEHTVPVAFAGSSRVLITDVTVKRVNATSGFAAVQESQVTIDNATFDRNVGKSGSAFIGRAQAVVVARSITVTNSRSGEFGGAVAFTGCCNATISDSWLAGNNAALGGGAVYAGESSTLVISNTVIEENKSGIRGGGGIMSSSILQLSNGTKILNNTVNGNGGGVFMQSYGSLPARLSLTPDTAVQGNAAILPTDGFGTGGGLYFEGRPQFYPAELQAASVTDNWAVRCPGYFEAPANVTLLSNNRVMGYVSRTVEDQGLLKVDVRVSGDMGTVCDGYVVSAYVVQPGNNASRGGGDGSGHNGGAPSGRRLHAVDDGPLYDSRSMPLARSKTSANGTARLSLKLERPPGVYLLRLVVEAPYDLSEDVSVEVRGCVMGEKPMRPGVCDLCPNGTYNFEPGPCHTCPADADCPGGALVLSKPGFWQSSQQSQEIHRCPNQAACRGDRRAMLVPCNVSTAQHQLQGSTSTAAQQEVCLEGSTYALKAGDSAGFAQQQCSQGYEGNLCGKCAEWYGSTRPFQCQQCHQKSTFIGLYVLAALLLLVAMKLLCWLTLRESDTSSSGTSRHQQQQQQQQQQQPKVEASHLLRQLVLHGQYTLIIASVQAVEYWPVTISMPLKALALTWAPASPETLAPDCMVWYGARLLPPGVVKVVFYTVTPVALLLMLVMLELSLQLIRSNRQRRRRRRLGLPSRQLASSQGSNLVDDLVATCVVAVFFFLPSIVRVAVGLFACKQIDQAPENHHPLASGSFWIHDTNQTCFAGWHWNLSLGLGIPLLLFVAAVPAYILWLTLPGRGKAVRHVWRKHYDVLVRYYSDKHRYWEAVVATETIILVSLSVFSFTLGPYYQALVMNLAIAMVLMLLMFIKPLQHKEAQQVAVAGMGCLYLTSYSAMTFAQSGARASSVQAPEAQLNTEVAAIPLFMGVVVVVVNLAFVLWVLWQLAELVNWGQVRMVVCDLWTMCARALFGKRRTAAGRGTPWRVLQPASQRGRDVAQDAAPRRVVECGGQIQLSTPAMSDTAVVHAHTRDQDQD